MELTSWDIEQIERLCYGNKNAGKLVITKTGKRGRTFNHEDMVNGKVCVHLDDGGKMLCNPEGLKVNGFID